ncbi:MAG: DUF1631 domain-containing protein [Porticoccaceae bacterium]|nr:DUF1631 domain-containing protein [Porticoccaceae bacterium]
MAEGHLHIVKNGTTLQPRQTGVLPPPLRMLRDRAERHFAARLKAVFEQVDDTFFDLADRSDNSRQQTLYFDAMRLIRFERKNIESAFQNSLELAFDSLVNSEAAEKRQQRHQKNSAFELADGDELEEIIALDAMVSRADEGNRQQLQILATRLESLTGQGVSLKDNPLGPDVVCDTFFRATADLDIGIRSKLVLLKLFERHVVSPLGDFLSQSNQLLQELGVLPELEKRQGAEAQPIRSKSKDSSRHPGDFLDRDSLQQQQKNYGRLVGQLNSVMARQWQQSEDENNGKLPTLPEAAPAEVVKAVDQLEVTGVSSLLERLQQQLAGGDHPMSLGSTERGLVHLVDALFDHICADQSLPPTLEKQMAELQVAIAKAALSDSGFFDKQRHPARRLFNEIVQAAQGYTESENLDSDPLYPHVSQALQQLLRCACSPVRLTQALTELVSITEKQRRQALSREQHLLEDEQASSQLHHSYNAVKQLLSQGMAGHTLPKVVVTFAEQAWCKVLFLSHLREGSESTSWQRAKGIFEQVLNGCCAKGNRSCGDEAAEGLKLVANIRSKLAEIALDPYQTEHLVRDLEKLLTAESVADVADSETVVVEQIYPAIPGEQKTLMPGDALPSMEKLSDAIEEHFLHDAETIPTGCWVEFSASGSGFRARYIGSAGPQNIHIFVDRQGHKVAAGNSRQLAHLLKNNQLIVIDNSPLFDRALAAVIDSMRQQ